MKNHEHIFYTIRISESGGYDVQRCSCGKERKRYHQTEYKDGITYHGYFPLEKD